jgi:hypothetical protein
MKFIGAIGVAVAVLLIGGCGKENKGLTQAQSGRLGTTLDALGRAQTAGMQAQGNPITDATPANADQAVLRMSQRLRPNVCKFDTLAPGKSDFALKISGKDCPMEMNFSIGFAFAGTSKKVTQATEFKVKDAELKAMTDIDAFSLKGTFESEEKFDFVGGMPGVKVSSKLGMNGSAHSQKDGDIKIEISGGGNGEGSNDPSKSHGKFEYVAKLSYSDFTAEFKRVQEVKAGKLEAKYYLNGDEMTEAQFQEYLKRAGVVFAVMLPESK